MCGARAGGGRPAALRCSALRWRSGCPAVLGLGAAPRNSLRVLRPLHSNNRGESDDDACCARRPRALRSSPPHRRAAGRPPPALAGSAVPWGRGAHPPRLRPASSASSRPTRSRSLPRCKAAPNTTRHHRLCEGGCSLLSANRSVAQAKGRRDGLRRACAAPRSTGLEARARSALRQPSRRGCLNAAAEGREVSSAAGPRDRAPQGSRSEARTAAPKRRSPSLRPFASRRPSHSL